MTERKAKGFHALERKIHELEEEDRPHTKREPERKVELKKEEEKPRVAPPAAHDE